MRALLLAATLVASSGLAAGVTLELPTVTASADFVSPLAPYGTWVSVGGTRAFQPSVSVVGSDFIPYSTGGQWVSTDAGWVFESSLPFAWATFHYGRWYLDPHLGWLWFPDTTWGPAWVDWRFGNGYAGWAPLPPPRYVTVVQPRWVFVETRWFGTPGWHAHRISPGRAHAAFAVTAPVPAQAWHGSRWHMGPPRHEVERVTGRAAPRVSAAQFVPPPSFRPSHRPHHVATPGGSAVPPPSRGAGAPPHGMGGRGVPPPPAHGMGGRGVPPPSAHGMGGRGVPPPPHGMGGRGVPPPPAHGMGGRGVPPPPHGMGGRGVPPPPRRQTPGFSAPRPSGARGVPAPGRSRGLAPRPPR